MAGKKKDEFDLLKKFSCTTCLAVMQSLEEESQFLPEIRRTTKAGVKEISECLSFAEENLFVKKCGENCYKLSDKGREALKRFRGVSHLICEP
jgi:hypothetical protein